jgi:NTE family protein
MKLDWKAEGKTALVLSGGGARGAYQVGVLKAVSDMFPKQSHNPFSIISGTSAGAVNAVAIAASANNFRLSIKKVEKIWNSLHVCNVYNADSLHLAYSVLRLILSLFNDGIGRRKPVALLDNTPLRELMSHVIHFRNIQDRINKGYLDAVSVTASSYSSGKSATFFQANSDIHRWSDHKADGIPAVLSVKHLMASSALPTIFPAEQLGMEYYGDGALRQLSPISSALRMGAERVMVIGVSGNPSHPPQEHFEQRSPSLAKMMGHVFNSAFVDTLENDLGHLIRINELVGIIGNENPKAPTAALKNIDLLLIEPSIEFDKIAEKHVADLPRSMRAVLHITGATAQGGGGSMASYLLFESAFCQELIRHGYQDAMEQEAIIRQFFGLEAAPDTAPR